MPTDSSWLAPAKLNLFLHITGRRSDGYHELQTVFQLLDYGDSLNFHTTQDGVLALQLNESSSFKFVPLDDNLILRAAKQLRNRLDNPKLGARISLTKQLPMGAGLGGGSSDAATTLLALNQLWKADLPFDQLMEIGVNLGADVPVFLGRQSAWAEGIGEQLDPVELPVNWYLVLTPEVEVATEKVFAQPDLTRNSPAIKIADFLAGRARNDCESTTCKLYPEVDRALNWLSQFAEARMTGTGSSIFASFPDSASAEAVLQQLPQKMTGFVAKGVNSLVPMDSAT